MIAPTDIRVYLALGSNLGDRAAALEDARVRLIAEGVKLDRASSVIETPPVGPPQPDYLNQVVTGTFAGSPRELLDRIHAIERSMGRVRTERWGPRTIDIDILTFGDTVIDEPALTIPHPELAARDFVLRPWAEIAPEYVVPGVDATVAALLARLASSRAARTETRSQ